MEIHDRDMLIEEIKKRHFAECNKYVFCFLFIAPVTALIVLLFWYNAGVHGFFPVDDNGYAVSYDEKSRVGIWFLIPMSIMFISAMAISIKKMKKNKRIDFLMRGKNG